MLLNNNLHIAVLLTCYNRKDKTLQCLQSFYKSINKLPELNFEIFLVDDGSSDGTTEAVQGFFPEICIIQGTGELYWNRGMHLAWETASKKKDFDYYLWLNDDVVLLPDAINQLFSDASKIPHSIICASMQSSQCQITYGGKDKKGILIIPNGSPQEITFINGNLVLIPKSVFHKVGMIDPIFPHAIGDYDYGLRAGKLGIKSYIASAICGYCEANHSLPAWCQPKVSLKNRIKSLYSPLGRAHPKYYFIYEKRNFGILKAIKHFVTIHIRVLFPGLWGNRVTFFR